MDTKTYHGQATLNAIQHQNRSLVLFLPPEVAERLGGHGTRVKGKVNGVPFRLAILSTSNGAYYLSTNKDLRKKAALSEGAPADLEIAKDPQPKQVELSTSFAHLLKEAPEIKRIWDEQTVGFQRSIAHYLTSAKKEETQVKRAAEIGQRLLQGTLRNMKKG